MIDQLKATLRELRRARSERALRRHLLAFIPVLEQYDLTFAGTFRWCWNAKPYLAMQMLSAQAFVLTPKQAILARPHLGTISDPFFQNKRLGAPILPVLEPFTPYQQAVLTILRAFVESRTGCRGSSLADPALSLEDNLARLQSMLPLYDSWIPTHKESIEKGDRALDRLQVA